MSVNQPNQAPRWLAFELNVLHRLNFKSVLLPLAGEPALGAALKRRGIKVSANDAARWSHVKSLAEIQNNEERLSEKDLAVILEDAYVPGYKLQNPALRNWFTEPDAWWFDNVRRNIEKLESETRRAMALSIGMQAGDYILSFTEATRQFRQPLSKVYARLFSVYPAPFNNRQENIVANVAPGEFIAANFGDLMFLRLPAAHNASWRNSLGTAAWREEWARTNGEFWNEAETKLAGNPGTRVETKSQYLQLIEEFLKTASHIQTWAIAYAEDGYITTHEIAEIIAQTRRVETIFTKDFSELTGAKAGIITA